MNIILFALLGAVSLATSPIVSADSVGFGFETSEPPQPATGATNLSCSGNCPQVSGDVARLGARSLKIVVDRIKSANLFRTEAVHGSPLMDANSGEKTRDYWVGFSMYIPAPYNQMTFPVYELFFQHYMSPPEGETWSTYKNNSPPIALYLRPETNDTGQIRVLVRASNNTYPQPFPLPVVQSGDLKAYKAGRWYDFVMNTRLDSTSAGFVKIWIDRELVLDYSGPTYARGHGGANRKFGLYTGWGTREISGEAVSVRTLYFDEYRFGYGVGVGYDTVAPGGNPEPPMTLDSPSDLRVLEE